MQMPLDRMIGQPTTTTVNHLKQQIAKIAAAVKTTKWGGRPGHLALVLDNTSYQAVTGHATLPDGTTNNTNQLNAPPILPVGITNSTTVVNKIPIMATHTLAQQEFWKQEAIDAVLVKKL